MGVVSRCLAWAPPEMGLVPEAAWPGSGRAPETALSGSTPPARQGPHGQAGR